MSSNKEFSSREMQITLLAGGLTVINLIIILLGKDLPHDNVQQFVLLTIGYCLVAGLVSAGWAWFVLKGGKLR